jgi:RHS repeat-associated protein
MTQFSFTADYDAYGQPLKQLAIAVPRGRNYMVNAATDPDGGTLDTPFSGWMGDPYLATVSKSAYAQIDTGSQYMVDRVCRSTSYEILNNGTESVLELRDRVLNQELPIASGNAMFNIIGHSVNFYDGAAFTGLPIGQLGNYGALVRSETLVITDAIINAAYENTPECFKDIPDWGTGYPASFAGMLQNGDERLGYLPKDHATDSNYTTGFYTATKQIKYDFHDDPATAKGLLLETRDPFGNAARIEYDQYKLLPIKAHQVIDSGTDYKLTTEAEYDYRVLQAKKITDPNGNRSEFGFTPLGLLEKSAIMGKEGENKGDTLDHPSVRMEYDFFAWKDGQQPVWVKTVQRINHWQDGISDETIEAVEYTDGFGRLLQTRSLAEDVIFGDSLFGDSGLPSGQSDANQPAIGVQRPSSALPNVRVSGFQLYDNKGKVVEQYEPYFDRGFHYNGSNPSASGGEGFGAAKVRMYYDPRGQVVRTVNPDNSQQWVLFGRPTVFDHVSLNDLDLPTLDNHPESGLTPWESYSFDANDLAPHSHPSGSGVHHTHHWTPSSNVVDALGRTVRTTERLEANEEVVMRYEYDIRGNVLRIIDALDRTVFQHTYDLANQSLHTHHLDAGEKRVLLDATGKPVEMQDAKGSRILNSYDTLNRPLQIWAKDNASQSFTVRQHVVYGDDLSNGPSTPAATNHLGKPYKSYDESGLSTALEYDFKGNLLAKKKEVIKDSLLLAAMEAGAGTGWDISPYRTDWTDAPWDEEADLLEGDYRTDFQFDALNRAIEVTYPADINAVRKVATPTFNRAGALEKVEFDGTPYINHIAYNAKGQPLLTAYGNSFMTRHVYDPLTFRLVRSRTEKYSYNLNGNLHEYDRVAGNVRQDMAYQYDLVGNILMIGNRVSDCGINGSPLGSDALDRVFKYDPLYRLLEATGRESNTQNQNDFTYGSATELDNYPNVGVANADNVRTYTRKYAYDTMGNITQMKQLGSNGFTRNFNYQGGKNTLNDIRTGSSALIEDFTYDTNGNQVTAGTTRNYEWDYADRMRAYYNQTGSAEPTVYAHYVYDGNGSRVKKLVRNDGGTWESITYIDGVFEYHKSVNGGTEEKNYTQVDGGVEIRTGSFTGDISDTTIYHLSDHLNSAAIRLNVTGGVIDREEFYPYGDTSLRTFEKKRYRYTGKEKDAESGLYYYGARYYAAWTCQFLSVDAMAGETVGFSPYAYANNNPVMFNDPTGNQAEGGGDGGDPPETRTNSFSVPLMDDDGNTIGHTTTEITATLNDDGTYTLHSCSTSYTMDDNGDMTFHSSTEYQESGIGEMTERGKSVVNEAFGGFLAGAEGEIAAVLSRMAYDGWKRGQYLDEIKINSMEFVEKIEQSNSLEKAEQLAREAVDTRNTTRVEMQGKLTHTGEAISKTIDSPKTFESISEKPSVQDAAQIGEKNKFKEIAKSSGKSHWGMNLLGGFAKWAGVAGDIIAAILAVARIVQAPKEERAALSGEELGNLVGGIIGGYAGGALAVAILMGTPVGWVGVAVVGAFAIGGGLVFGDLGGKFGRYIGSPKQAK